MKNLYPILIIAVGLISLFITRYLYDSHTITSSIAFTLNALILILGNIAIYMLSKRKQLEIFRFKFFEKVTNWNINKDNRDVTEAFRKDTEIYYTFRLYDKMAQFH